MDIGRPLVQAAGHGGLAQHGDLRHVGSLGYKNKFGGTRDAGRRNGEGRVPPRLPGAVVPPHCRTESSLRRVVLPSPGAGRKWQRQK